MKHYKWTIGLVLLLVLVGCSTPNPTATVEPTPTEILTPQPFSLTLLYTNDGWGYNKPCTCDPSAGGFPRRASFIKSVRAAKEHVLLVDSGDSLMTLQHLGDLEQGKLLVEAYNKMGYDAVALGGMDFRMGLDVLRKQIETAEFSVLSANVLDPEASSFFDRDYEIFQIAGHKIAVIGLTDSQTALDVTGNALPVYEPVQSLADLVSLIQDEADIIIVLSHLGAEFDLNLGLVVPGIDIVISGKDKKIYTKAVETDQYLLVSAGSRGEFIGQLDLNFDEAGQIVDYDMVLQQLTEEIADDTEIAQWMLSSGMISASSPKSATQGELSQ